MLGQLVLEVSRVFYFTALHLKDNVAGPEAFPAGLPRLADL